MFSLLKRFKYFDIPLLIAMLLLSFSGLAILYGTTMSQESKVVFYRQLSFFAVGFSSFLFISFFDYHNLAKLNRALYVILFGLLIYILAFGLAVKGGRRWIDLGIGSFQPAEFIKLSVILGMSRLMYLKRGQINSLKTLIWSLSYVVAPAFLVAIQPDLGSALIIMGLWLGIILISPIKKKVLAILFIIFIITVGVSWEFLLKDYQKNSY